jgi:predicted pyridoxine 5'-phosphate oxidase superfamily flavin-nucleotide-binding protein
MAARKKRTGIEWVGGIVAMPAYVTDEGEPYRPDALFWMSTDCTVLGHTMGKPGKLVELACESLRSTIAQPMFGRPHAPDRVRVASPALAEALRAGQPDLEVVCAPTPEIDALFVAMRERMLERAETEESYLAPDIGPAAVAAFFRAAAALFRAKPWKTVPSDQSLFSVSIEKLGVTDAVLSVIGQMGRSLGLILFSDIHDFEAYLDAADAMEHGEELTIPPHFVLNFEHGAKLSAALRKEIAKHHWEVAGADAYPWLGAVDEDRVARPPTAAELTIAEAIALALPKLLEEKNALLAAWNGGEPVARTLIVATHTGDVEVSLRVPYEREPSEYKRPHDMLAELFELGQDGDEIDAEARRRLEDELVRRFVASPEAKALPDVSWCHLVMDFAADYFNATIATLGPRELRELVFDIIPRKVSVDASAASRIIEENRAFYAFLKREFALEQADACLRVLGGDAVKKLEAALSDTSKFGMAKSLFMAGREAGFDMDSKEGIEAWMRLMQSQPLPESLQRPSLGSPARTRDKAAARAKKNARKAARKARKKNR